MVDKVNEIEDSANKAKKIEYRDCYVAFLDILGFKELIKTSECSDIFNLMEECVNSCKFYIDDVLETSKITKEYLNSIFEEITLNLISDSVVISVPSDRKCSLDVLVFVICSLIIKCFKDYGVLFRGGISKGDFFAFENKVYGPALNDAYLLESQNAKFPRVIFTAELLEDYLAKNFNRDFNILSTAIEVDKNDYFNFVDYLFFLMHQGKANAETEEQKKGFSNLIDKINKKISDELATEKNPGVREKYVWLKEYMKRAKKRDSEHSAFTHNGVTL